MTILVPAYGRDYKSESQVQEDWDANKDFLIQDISSEWDGRYACKRDMAKDEDQVKIRFNRLASFAFFKTKE